MTEPDNHWKLRVRGGETDLPLIRLMRDATALRVVIHNSDEVTTPALVDPKGRVVAEGAEAITEYLELVHQSERV